jgi:peptide/nickel transport system permease protein
MTPPEPAGPQLTVIEPPAPPRRPSAPAGRLWAALVAVVGAATLVAGAEAVAIIPAANGFIRFLAVVVSVAAVGWLALLAVSLARRQLWAVLATRNTFMGLFVLSLLTAVGTVHRQSVRTLAIVEVLLSAAAVLLAAMRRTSFALLGLPGPRDLETSVRPAVAAFDVAAILLLGGWTVLHVVWRAPKGGGGWIVRLAFYLAVGLAIAAVPVLVARHEPHLVPFGMRGMAALVMVGWWFVILLRRGNPGTVPAWFVWVPFMTLAGLVFLVMPFTPTELGGFVGRRLLSAIPVIIVASFLVYAFVSSAGDPLAQLRMQPKISAITIANKEKELLLNLPILIPRCANSGAALSDSDAVRQLFGGKSPEGGASWCLSRYPKWFWGFVRGDFGKDIAGNAVKPQITRALSVTLQLVVLSTLLGALLAIGIGVISAVKQYSIFDYGATSLAYFGYSMPVFWAALMAKQYFGIELAKVHFPVIHNVKPFSTVFESTPGFSGSGWAELGDRLSHLALPVAVLSIAGIAAWSRFQRTAMLDVINSDYVRTARAKGLSRSRVVLKHALRNALIPLVTVMTIDFAGLLGGAVVTETVFGWKGMGQLLIHSITSLDVNVVAGWLVVTAIMVVTFNLLADVLYGFLDPRIRYE